MSTDKSLTYRANLKAIGGSGGDLFFVGTHDEKFATSLYKLDVDKAKLAEVALPCGGVSLLVVDDIVYVGGDDNKIYSIGAKAKTASPLSAELPNPQRISRDLATIASRRCAQRILSSSMPRAKPNSQSNFRKPPPR